MWAALLARLQGWLLMAGAVLMVLVGAYAAGGRAARRSAEIDASRREAEVNRRLRDVDDELSQVDDGGIRDRLGEWVRPADPKDR